MRCFGNCSVSILLFIRKNQKTVRVRGVRVARNPLTRPGPARPDRVWVGLAEVQSGRVGSGFKNEYSGRPERQIKILTEP